MRLPGKLLQKALCTAPATQKGSAEALCTAPARQKAAAGQRRPPRRSSARKLCVLRVPRKREVRRLKCGRLLRLPGKKRQPRASGSHRAAAPPESCALRLPRTREVRRLCVLRRPHERQLRPSSSWRLCVLRVPHERQPGSYLYSE